MDYFPTLGEKRARSRGNVSKYFLYGTSEIWHRRNSKSFGVRILSFGVYVTHGMIRLFLYGGVHQWFLYLWRILINGGWNIFTDPWNFEPPLRFKVRSCPLTWNTFTGISKTIKWKEFPKINCFLWGTCGVCSRGYVGKFLEMIFSSYFGDRRSAMTQASTLVAWILLFLKMQVKVPASGPKLPWKSLGHFWACHRSACCWFIHFRFNYSRGGIFPKWLKQILVWFWIWLINSTLHFCWLFADTGLQDGPLPVLGMVKQLHL